MLSSRTGPLWMVGFDRPTHWMYGSLVPDPADFWTALTMGGKDNYAIDRAAAIAIHPDSTTRAVKARGCYCGIARKPSAARI